MEGLIPFIYKAIKERQSRSYSRYPSTRDSLGGGGGDWEQRQWLVARPDPAQDVDGWPRAEKELTHRRHRSLEELAGEVGGSPDWWRLRRLPKARSVRIFSCVGGF